MTNIISFSRSKERYFSLACISVIHSASHLVKLPENGWLIMSHHRRAIYLRSGSRAQLVRILNSKQPGLNQELVRLGHRSGRLFINRIKALVITKNLQLHTSPNFKQRNAKLDLKKNSPTLKVLGLAFDRNHQCRFRVKIGHLIGYVTALPNYVCNAYYQKFLKINLKIKRTVFLHRAFKFTRKNIVRKLKPGRRVHIKKLVVRHGIARFLMKRGFITANRDYVK